MFYSLLHLKNSIYHVYLPRTSYATSSWKSGWYHHLTPPPSGQVLLLTTTCRAHLPNCISTVYFSSYTVRHLRGLFFSPKEMNMHWKPAIWQVILVKSIQRHYLLWSSGQLCKESYHYPHFTDAEIKLKWQIITQKSSYLNPVLPDCKAHTLSLLHILICCKNESEKAWGRKWHMSRCLNM